MKTILIKDKKVFICEEITANCNESYIQKPLIVDADKLILALQKRMENCISKLQEAYNSQAIIETSEHTITYIGGHFHIPSYNTMEETINLLQLIIDVKKTTFIDTEDLKSLTYMQLNQLKKAIIAFDKDWTSLASDIEAIEAYKMGRIFEN
jgi:hypothetical protein